MRYQAIRVLAAAALLAALGTTFASAQAPKTMRVRGVIEKVDGDKIAVKQADGAVVTLTLTANALIVGVNKATLADIKSGSYVGSAAMPQADGSQKALEVHIFAESQRGTGEGSRPFSLPNSTMTNGTVGDMVTATGGGTITVKYKDGEKKVIVPPNTPVVRFAPGTKDDLKPGAQFFIVAATKQSDGSYTAPAINVGRDGAAPPM
jgi:Cu/Ag efflux protein CusF